MKSDENKYFEANKSAWNKKVPVHAKSEFYDVDGFKNGKSSLNPAEIEILGDIKGKSLLHLQCHFGQDTLALAQLGADVTGVDFSEEAIRYAENLRDSMGLNGKFICSNIYDLENNLDEMFDIIYTSYGVVGWLPDLNEWGRLISRYLKPGGTFLIIEFHPVLMMFNDEMNKIIYSYFFNEAPIVEQETGTYADRNADLSETMYGWNHHLSEITDALILNGLKITSVKEYPYSYYNCFSNLIQGEDGYWRVKGYENIIPMMYSVKAVK